MAWRLGDEFKYVQTIPSSNHQSRFSYNNKFKLGNSNYCGPGLLERERTLTVNTNITPEFPYKTQHKSEWGVVMSVCIRLCA